MGFFKDFKDDLSQAVNEMITEPATDSIKDEDVIVNTLDDAAVSDMVAFTEKEDIQSLDTPTTANNLTEVTNDEIDSENSKTAEVQETVNEAEEIVDETALITKSLTVVGDLNAKGSIDLFGVVQGNVVCRGKLAVSGTIIGHSKAFEVFANNAQIDGNIEATGPVKIGQGSVIVGNISATSAVIAGAVKGDIDVHGPVIVDTSAIIIGDIKSKSVQINNGATIEGRCSQCYADVNPNSIFEKDRIKK